MENKLTLEHIAPYLPYGVEVVSNINNFRYKVLGMYENEILIDECFTTGWYAMSNFKLRLRPMSDFDKMDNEFDLNTDFETAYVTNRTDIAFINTSDKTYLSDIKTVVKFLFENHFDVFGLIEKGLAVDINTIK